MVYCLPLFGGCDSRHIQDLQVLQSKIARIVTNSGIRTNRNIMFDRLEWMTVKQMIVYHTLLTIYKIRLTGEPEEFASALKNENRNQKIITPLSRLTLYRRSFLYRGSIDWNTLPSSLRNSEKLGVFKKGLRIWILDNITRF